MDKLEELLKAWNEKPSNPLLRGRRTMSDAEDLIDALQIELAGKESVIKALHDDIRYYRKDWKDTQIQDQGLSHDQD